MRNRYTKVSNIVRDSFLPQLSSNAWKIYSVIERRTLGYHREKMRDSVADLCRMTGLSKNSVLKGLRELEKMELILRRSTSGRISQEITIVIPVEWNW